MSDHMAYRLLNEMGRHAMMSFEDGRMQCSCGTDLGPDVSAEDPWIADSACDEARDRHLAEALAATARQQICWEIEAHWTDVVSGGARDCDDWLLGLKYAAKIAKFGLKAAQED